jgi:hypothetical protein
MKRHPDGGAAVGALPRRGVRGLSHRADHQGRAPGITTVLGGGFVNTELRELNEPRVFDHFDFVTLDAGERPLLALLEHLQGRRGAPAPGAHLRARPPTARCAT